jgi:hypothetical protein
MQACSFGIIIPKIHSLLINWLPALQNLLYVPSSTTFAAVSIFCGSGNIHTVKIVSIAEIRTVPKNTMIITIITLPIFFERSIFAIEEAIAKKIRGITAVKRRFKNISPMGLITSTCLPKNRPKKVPIVIPRSSLIILA